VLAVKRFWPSNDSVVDRQAIYPSLCLGSWANESAAGRRYAGRRPLFDVQDATQRFAWRMKEIIAMEDKEQRFLIRGCIC